MSREFAYILITNQSMTKILIRKRSDGEFAGSYDFIGNEVDLGDKDIRYPDIPHLGLFNGKVNYTKLITKELIKEIDNFEHTGFRASWSFDENMLFEIMTYGSKAPGYPITYKFALSVFDERFVDTNVVKHDSLYWVEPERVLRMKPFAHSEDGIAEITISSFNRSKEK